MDGFEFSTPAICLVDSKYSLNQIRDIDVAFTFDRSQDQDAQLSDFPIRGVHTWQCARRWRVDSHGKGKTHASQRIGANQCQAETFRDIPRPRDNVCESAAKSLILILRSYFYQDIFGPLKASKPQKSRHYRHESRCNGKNYTDRVELRVNHIQVN